MERPDLDSDLVQQQHIAIAETFTLEFNMEGEGDFDLLYHYGSVDDIWLGNWGIFRSYEKRVRHLMPLGDSYWNLIPNRKKPLPRPTGKKPPRVKVEEYSYPKEAFVRKYDVYALNSCIVYNKNGDHDPNGIVYALKEDVDDLLSGKKNPKPLIIRGNVGEYVEVKLTNLLKGKDHHDSQHGYPEVPVEAFYPTSDRISMHAQLVEYDVRNSDGATVGFNYDQTIGPGDCITYSWYIDRDIGSVNLTDMADVRNHRHHGAFGMLIAEPRGSKFLDSKTREHTDSGEQVIISNPLLPEFREFALIMHDGVRLLDKNGKLIIDPAPLVFKDVDIVLEEEQPDFEDQGSRGFNYRYEPFRNRVKKFKDIHKVFSSKVFGDPSTPILLAYPGDPITIRLTHPADRPRTRTFAIHGHKFLRSEDDLNSTIISARPQMTVGTTDDLHLFYGAGGLLNKPGDYMYRSGNIRWDIELGMWGILRVLKTRTNTLAPLNGSNGKVKLLKENRLAKFVKKNEHRTGLLLLESSNDNEDEGDFYE